MVLALVLVGLEPLDPTVTVGFYCVPVLNEPEYGVSVKVPSLMSSLATVVVMLIVPWVWPFVR